jgi:hypothetical protein
VTRKQLCRRCSALVDKKGVCWVRKKGLEGASTALALWHAVLECTKVVSVADGSGRTVMWTLLSGDLPPLHRRLKDSSWVC